MILVDTGHLLALAQPTDALHARALAWAAQLDEPLLVTEYVLVETVNGLSRLRDRARAHRVAEAVTDGAPFQLLPGSARWLKVGLQLFRDRADKEWSLTDCISFQVMREHGITRALAYDEHFEQAGFTALLRGAPPPA